MTRRSANPGLRIRNVWVPSSRGTAVRHGVTPTRVSDGRRKISAPCGVDSISMTRFGTGGASATGAGLTSEVVVAVIGGDGAAGGGSASAGRSGGRLLANRLIARYAATQPMIAAAAPTAIERVRRRPI